MRYIQYIPLQNQCHAKASIIGGEATIIVTGENPQMSFCDQLCNVELTLKETLETIGDEYKTVFVRYFLSDITNQTAIIDSNQWHCAVSKTGQPPLNGTKVAIWAHAVKGATNKKITDEFWESEICGTKYYWFSGQMGEDGTSKHATESLLSRYTALLSNEGCTLAENCHRTWFYVHDIDTNYQGMVKGRNNIFASERLTPSTHFIASTGIGGMSAHASHKVKMDAYAIGTTPELPVVNYLNSADHLNPTIEYGVAFERATRIDHCGKSNVIVSGTASIDNRGHILYPCDITRQFIRMTENVEALLREGKCTTSDIGHIIIYLRDISDYATVKILMEEKYPEVPYVIVNAPVCRPGWLVEMECTATRLL